MSHPPNEPAIDRPPVIADAAPPTVALEGEVQPEVAIKSDTWEQIGLVATLAVALSFFLPWARVGTVRFSGFKLFNGVHSGIYDLQAPVLLTVPIGMLVAAALLGLRLMVKRGKSPLDKLAPLVTLLAGAASIAVMVYVYLAWRVVPFSFTFGSFTAVVGSLVAIGAGVLALLSVVGEKRFGKISVPTTTLRAYTMVLALIVIWLFFQWTTIDEAHPYGLFLGAINFSKLLQQMAVTGVLAVGMLMIIVAGQIDLSVGSVVGLVGGIAALTQGWGLVPSLASAIIMGIVIGAVQGGLVAYANIPAFIVTLGGLLAWRGVILGLTQGSTIGVDLQVFKSIGRDFLAPVAGWVLAAIAIAAIVGMTVRRNQARRRHKLPVPATRATIARITIPVVIILVFIYVMNSQGGVPIPVVILLGVALIGAFVTQNTTFGRYLYAIGGNPDAARLSGISLRLHILAAFCVMGALVGVASLVHTSRVGSASPDAGTYMELDAIAACVIGGTSLMGGRGTVSGACVGALIMASLDNGMSLLNVESYTQLIIKGAVLVAAVGFDMLGRRKG